MDTTALETLQARKKAIEEQTDLDKDERKKQLRAIRKQIRKVKADLGITEDAADDNEGPAPEPGSPEEEAAEEAKRQRRRQARAARRAERELGIGVEAPRRDWRKDAEAFQQYRTELEQALIAKGLLLMDHSVSLTHKGMGFDVCYAYDRQKEPSVFIEKFQARWGTDEPATWFLWLKQGPIPILVLGPIPAGH